MFFHAACRLCADWTTYAPSTDHNTTGFISNPKHSLMCFILLQQQQPFTFPLLQYLKHLHAKAHHILERFALLICIAIIWAFAAILTVAGAYNTSKEKTQTSCRTDRSYLLTRAPWYVAKVVYLGSIWSDLFQLNY